MEFDTKTAKLEFNKLFKMAFPDGCTDRQKADLLCFFLAGYTSANSHWGDAIVKMGLVAAPEFINEINQDTMKQLGFCIEKMKSSDFSHAIFK